MIIDSKDLPLPRLQLTWKQESGLKWNCSYDLLIPVDENDGRNKNNTGCIKVNLGQTEVTGSSPLRTEKDGKRYLNTPFRDGAHAVWDSSSLCIPAFIVYENVAEAIPASDVEEKSGPKVQLETIAPEHQKNVIDNYWMMLRDCERNAKSILDKHMVEGHYRTWNAVTGSDQKPDWVK